VRECLILRNGYRYEGNVRVTVSGKNCQAWNLNTPHANLYIDSAEFPDGSSKLAENKCRNPSWNSTVDRYLDGVWCYTMDPDLPFEACDVPLCGTCNKKDFILSLFDFKHYITV